MAGTTIRKGTRLQVAFAPNPGETANFTMASTFNKKIDDSAFLISVPMHNGKALPADETKKMLIRYGEGNDTLILEAYCDDEVKEGVRNYWKMRKVAERRQFYQRADERYKVALHVSYTQPTWPLNAAGNIDMEEAVTLDISAGGVALYLHLHMDVGENLLINFPRVGTAARGAAIDSAVARICWYREAPRGSLFKFICGVQFRFANDAEHQKMADYIENIKEIYKL